MKNRVALTFLTFLLTAEVLLAQGSGTSTNNGFMYLISALVILALFIVIVRFLDKRQASKGEVIRLKQGHDILLKGEAEAKIEDASKVNTFAVTISDYLGISPIPKMLVEVGDKVKSGDAIFFDKKKPEVIHVAPVSGEILDVKRGEKRSITQVIIKADKEMAYKTFSAPDISKASREDIVKFMLESGVWTCLRQRPFDVMPDPEVTPRDIYISTFDSAPLAPNLNLVVEGKEAAFQKGLDVLAKLTSGKVNLGLDARKGAKPAAAFAEAKGVEKFKFDGKHPIGNVSVQIHNTKPLANGDVIWTLGVQDVVTLGELFLSGKFDASRVVVLSGAELKTPKYVKTYQGASLGELLEGNLANDNVRIISGDVLSGSQRSTSEFLGVYDDQVTVVEEGNDYEMFGWLVPSQARPTVSGTFLSKLMTNKRFKAETNTHGEKRAFVVTGLYEKLLPMDVYPQHLMKSIIIGDMEQMEGLGILELVEEDVALAEFACVSKQPLQSILREGLEKMRAES